MTIASIAEFVLFELMLTLEPKPCLSSPSLPGCLVLLLSGAEVGTGAELGLGAFVLVDCNPTRFAREACDRRVELFIVAAAA